MVDAVKEQNAKGISCTLDNLGEFVSDKGEANQAKEQILAILDTINKQNLDCHLSVKLTQLGLDIDQDYCIANMKDILDTAKQYSISSILIWKTIPIMRRRWMY